MKIINLSNVSKCYKVGRKNIFALRNVSYEINQGDAVGLIGMNGAGKSTSIKLLSGILKPTSGNIEVLGMQPYKKRKKLCYEYGVMFGQRSQLWWDLPAIDSFYIQGSIYGLSRRTIKTRIIEYSDMINLDYLKIPVRQLSLGQKMSCDILLAMIHRPKLLFLDEATIALDVFNRKSILQMIKNINQKMGVTVIITSHLLNDIEDVCNRVLLLNYGELYFDGFLKEFLNTSEFKKKIVIDFKDFESAIMLKDVIGSYEGLKIVSEGKRLIVFCRNEDILIQDLIQHLIAHYSNLEFSIQNISLEERMLSLGEK